MTTTTSSTVSVSVSTKGVHGEQLARIVTSSSSIREVAVKLMGCPEWRLNKMEEQAHKGYGLFSIQFKNGQRAYLPDMVRQVRWVWAMDLAIQKLLVEQPDMAAVPRKDLEEVFNGKEVVVKRGVDPIKEYDARIGDHSYTDWYWSSSREIAPGVFRCAEHFCMGGTKRWFAIPSPK